MTMTVEILNVIHAVLSYKKFICSQNRLDQFYKDDFDWFSETEKYYQSLNLPDGMSNNRIQFEKILAYGSSKTGRDELDKLDNAEELELSNFEW